MSREDTARAASMRKFYARGAQKRWQHSIRTTFVVQATEVHYVNLNCVGLALAT